MMFLLLIFIMDLTMNLINGSYYECEKKEHHSLYSKNI